jgi:hypothetical protein
MDCFAEFIIGREFARPFGDGGESAPLAYSFVRATNAWKAEMASVERIRSVNR